MTSTDRDGYRADGGDAMRSLAARRGRAGERLIAALADARGRTAEPGGRWAPQVAVDLGLPASAGLGPASYYADLAAPTGRRHVRVCGATACFAADGGRHLGEVEDAYNSGSMTRRSANLDLVGRDVLDVHPDDADRFGLRDGEPVVVRSRHGQAHLVARVGDATAPGQVFSTFHFPAGGVNRLTSDHADTVTSCPEYKVTAVCVQPG